MRRKSTSHLKIGTVSVAAALLVAWALLWPYRIVDTGHKSNLLLTRESSWLSTASPFTQLFNRLWPDHDSAHGRIMVYRPTDVDTTLLYPVVVVPQHEDEDFKSLVRQWQSLDSCYVIIVGRNNNAANGNHHLQMLDSTLIHWLDKCGMRMDPSYMTLVDRSADGSLSGNFAHRRLRNLVLTQASPGTTPCAARRIHFCPENGKDSSRMHQSYQALATMKVDADIYPTSVAIQHTVNEIALEHNPISQSRLAETQRQILERGYDNRYAMLVDFSIPSGKNRFFLYDFDNGKVVVKSKCAHGCGSGSTDAMPRFSNEHGSNATSLGLYEIDDVHRMYKNNRVAINLEGLEPTNDNARMRGIKVHGGMRYEGEIYPRYLHIGPLSEGCFALSNVPLTQVLVIVEQTAPRRILLNAYTH